MPKLKQLHYIKWFNEVGQKDVAIAGGKGANLGEMARLGFPVPPGFIVDSKAYYTFTKDLKKEISSALKGLDVEHTSRLNKVSAEIKALILSKEIPKDIQQSIAEAYKELCELEGGPVYVAVRSSATAEDLPKASFAGEQATFLNIIGADHIIEAVKQAWASLWEPRAIYYRKSQGFSQTDISIAVPVQKMVESESSGVMFTIDPSKNDRSKILIEAAFGLGEVVVGGQVNVDSYLVNKKDLHIENEQIGKQEFKIVRQDSKNIKVKLSPKESSQQKIADDKIIELAKYGKKLEQHYDRPQDIEWALEKNRLYLVQTRSVTTLNIKTVSTKEKKPASEILRGLSASPGIVTGPVKIILNPEEIDKITKGDILVTVMTSPDYVPAMRKAAGIITDAGGRTSHAAIVSREMGIPCIIGTSNATKILRDGQLISIDANQGIIYEGAIKAQKPPSPQITIKAPNIITGTKIYVNLAQPQLAEKIAAQDVDGVGLLRAEFIIAQMNKHPEAFVKENAQEEFIDKLAIGISQICKPFYPRPVTYRTNDFKTNEYRNLAGGQEFEPKEENPMIGFRGCSRYATRPEVFEMELDAIKRVRQTYPNLQMMLPFVRTVDELVFLRKKVEEKGLFKQKDFKFWIMIEVPSTVFLIEDFLPYVDGVSIGSNDLTQLILGVDRDSQILATLFDERDPSVLRAMEIVVKACQKHGKTSSICGQAPSVYPEISEFLVGAGATSISVNPDTIETTRKIVAQAEQNKILKELKNP